MTADLLPVFIACSVSHSEYSVSQVVNKFNSKPPKKGSLNIYTLYLFAALCFCLSSINSQKGNYSLAEGGIEKHHKATLGACSTW